MGKALRKIKGTSGKPVQTSETVIVYIMLQCCQTFSWCIFLLFDISQVPQAEGRVTRRALKKLNGSVECVQSERASPNKRKSSGKKRKAEDSSSYMISEYLDKEVIMITEFFKSLSKLINFDFVWG